MSPNAPRRRVPSDPRRLGAVASRFFANRLYVPAHLAVVLRDAVGARPGPAEPRTAMQAAVDWLLRAQDAAGGGVAAYYSLRTGWAPPYSETTGYIAPTLFDYHRLTGRAIYRERAIRMSDWQLTVQKPEGGFPGGHDDPASSPPVVFNTGQVLQGLVRAHRETGDERYREAARRAGDWLVAIQEPDGSWRRYTYRDTVHTYHTRVAWPLYELHQITGDDRYAAAADRHLTWALQNQRSNGWFENNYIYLRDAALTHSIAYAIEGFLEAGVLMASDAYVAAARKASDVLLERFTATGWLQASYDGEWNSSDAYSCLTGNAQMSIVWWRLFELTKDRRYAQAAADMNASLRATQDTTTRHEGIRGGIKGSDPIYGGYMPLCYLNWAAKFFVDALMLEERLRPALEGATGDVAPTAP